MRRILKGLHCFLGMDLPVRALPLNFTLPGTSAKFKAGNSNDGDFKRALGETKNMPSAYFRLLLAEIKHINRCAMKTRQRLVLTSDMIKLFYPVALAQMAIHAKNGGIPEDEGRRETLKLMVEIAQILIVSYQIVFAGCYRSSNYQYAKARKTVQQAAFRIFELLILKQQARALRYQLPDEQDWQLANTLFYVLSCYEDVFQPLPTMRKLLELGGSHTELCLHDLFVCLQMMSRFDMLRWPAHLQWVIGSYLHTVEHAVQIRVAEGNVKPGRDELIAYCYGGAAAGRHPLQVAPGPALMLDCSRLNDAIRKDCMSLMQAKMNRNAAAILPRFARFPEAAHPVISEQLLRGLESGTGDVCVEKEVRVEDLQIFVGFQDVFAMLRHKQGKYSSEERLADVLARRSALIAEDHLATEKSMWSLLCQNEKMIRLSTQETSFTTPMEIGSLLAYGVGDDIRRPSLAVVSRIFRPSDKVVVIDMHCIASYAEAVSMTVNADEQTKNGLNRARPALLVYSKKGIGGWGMVFAPQEILPGFDRLAIHRNKQEFAIGLKNRRAATNDFYLFSIDLQSDELGMAAEPDYAVAPVRKVHAPGWLL